MNESLDEAGFPLGGGALHTQSVPFARALGLQWLGLCEAADGGVAARLLLPCRPAVCDERGAIDRRAIVALLDHSGAPACYGARVAIGATATLDLRIDFLAEPVPGADVAVEAHCIHGDGRSALVTATARHTLGDGKPVARMTGRYVVGLGPGRANDASEPAQARAAHAARHAASSAPPVRRFDELMGGHFDDNAFVLGFEPWLVGSVALPALHGGVIAAGLMNAAQHLPGRPAGLALASLTLQFLRAAQATDTRFSARLQKAGARATCIEATATQQGGTRAVAALQALFA